MQVFQIEVIFIHFEKSPFSGDNLRGRAERKNKVVLLNVSDVVWKGLSAETL